MLTDSKETVKEKERKKIPRKEAKQNLVSRYFISFVRHFIHDIRGQSCANENYIVLSA